MENCVNNVHCGGKCGSDILVGKDTSGASPWARVEISVLSAAVEMRSQEHILGWVTTKAIHEHPLSKALWSISYFTAHLFKHEDPESWLRYRTLIIP